MGFAAGFKAGDNAIQDAIDAKNAKEYRDAQIGLARSRDAREQAEFGMRQRSQQRVEDATTAFDDMNNGRNPQYTGQDVGPAYGLPRSPEVTPADYGGPVGPSPGLQGDQAGPPAPRFEPSRQQRTAGLQRIALAKGDTAAAMALEAQSRKDQEDEVFANAMKQPFDEKLVEHINGTHQSVTIHDADKNGVRQVSLVTPDNKALLLKLTRSDQQKLQGALALMELNPTRALDIIGSVNQALAAQVAADNNLSMEALKTNNAAAGETSRITNDRQRTANDTTRTGYEGQRVGIERQRLGIEGARVGLEKERIGIERTRAERERLGHVQTYEDANGNVVAIMPTIGSDGKVRYDQVDLPPGLRMPKRGTGASGPAKPVPEEGTMMQDPATGQVFRADGRGGRVAPDGFTPKERLGLMNKAGLPKEVMDQVEWDPSGRGIIFGGMAYNPKDVHDMAQLTQDVHQFMSDSVMATESRSRGPGRRDGTQYGVTPQRQLDNEQRRATLTGNPRYGLGR